MLKAYKVTKMDTWVRNDENEVVWELLESSRKYNSELNLIMQGYEAKDSILSRCCLYASQFYNRFRRILSILLFILYNPLCQLLLYIGTVSVQIYVPLDEWVVVLLQGLSLLQAKHLANVIQTHYTRNRIRH
jgi:hypothetical protein